MNGRRSVIVGMACVVLSLSGIASAQTKVCGAIFNRSCSNLSDCKQRDTDYNTCEKNEAAKRRAENARKQQEYERQHKAEIDAVRKVDEINKALRGVGVPPK